MMIYLISGGDQMREILSANISRYRKTLGLTQEALAEKLSISAQAVSKWETGQTIPDTLLLPQIAKELNCSVDKLLGYTAFNHDPPYNDDRYRNDDFFWGVHPNVACLKVLELMPLTKLARPYKLLDVGCGEGRDAVFFARGGYYVSAFDISEAGLDKGRRLAESARVNVRFFRADMNDYRLSENYDVICSSGSMNYMRPQLRDEIMANYKAHLNEEGLVALHTVVGKPFLPYFAGHDDNPHFHYWKTGELSTYFHDWFIALTTEYIYQMSRETTPIRAANRLFALNKKEGFSAYKVVGGMKDDVYLKRYDQWYEPLGD